MIKSVCKNKKVWKRRTGTSETEEEREWSILLLQSKKDKAKQGSSYHPDRPVTNQSTLYVLCSLYFHN